MFPISNEQDKIIGFGGRVLDNSNPKYINSPESFFFKKRSILYNLNKAKKNIRKKNNMLICEGYMDVISLYNNNIKTAVAPLGTSLTESQLMLAWKFISKPTIMFDGDNSGLKASYKSALMALKLLTPEKYLQFIKLPKDTDPDNIINSYSKKDLIKLLKSPTQIVNFIFDQASLSIDLTKADNKISFDKFLDDIVSTISDNKIRYFYKNEFKNLFFNYLKNRNKNTPALPRQPGVSHLKEKQILSFLTAYLIHKNIRQEIYNILIDSNLFDESQHHFLEFFQKSQFYEHSISDLQKIALKPEINIILKKSMETSIFQLFPYTNQEYNSNDVIKEITDSVKNLKTRLLNLKKINKSLIEFGGNSSNLSWDELKKIGSDLLKDESNS